jgi:hypothetical protein
MGLEVRGVTHEAELVEGRTKEQGFRDSRRHQRHSGMGGGMMKRMKITPMDKSRDQDQGKGAVEQDQNNQGGNTSMKGQLGHRDEDVELKGADSDLSG